MDLDDEELIATRDGNKCKFCEEHKKETNNFFSISIVEGKLLIEHECGEGGSYASIKIYTKYCPICR